ncbi:MAG TPA: ATP-binding protein [Candidatus Methanoperedenaceae archaeon]|nr:ATP-binding protein [Candidatus Methanoperedenaceae archaeon]
MQEVETADASGVTPAYRDNLEHILDELRRIELMLRMNIERSRAEHPGGPNDFPGLYISEDEVTSILRSPLCEDGNAVCPEQGAGPLQKITSEIEARKLASIRKGRQLRLPFLAGTFRLEPFDVDVLLICLACELDIRFEKLYSYLQNDITRKRPTIDLVLKLLCGDQVSRLSSFEVFSRGSPLLSNHLIYPLEASQDAGTTLISRQIRLDDRILGFLLGSDEIDRRIEKFSRLIYPAKSAPELSVEGSARVILKDPAGRNMITYFHGPYGTGKKTAAEAACGKLGIPLLIIDSRGMAKDDPFDTLVIALREALLQGSAVYFDGFDTLVNERDASGARSILRQLDTFPDPVFLSGSIPWEPPGVLAAHGFMSIPFPVPSFELRRRIWESLLGGVVGNDIDVTSLAGKFKFSGGQIRDAIFTARNIAASGNGGTLSMDHLYRGCKAQSNRTLSSFSRRIMPRYTWNDIVLPGDMEKQLREISSHIKYKAMVYSDWGFDRKYSIGKGLNVLFAGPSGTGKTMAAEVIANDAGLDIYKIDLSGIVSKYIGETEKNLMKVFNEAETSNAILFFDEADALFGKRTEIRDSHDRYSNIEVNYLLQKIEEYEGIVILATNFKKNIDEAFLRRMQFSVDFPPPEEGQRERIWGSIFPKETPVDDGVDFGFLARIALTGGSIKNVAISAAFMAADDGKIVTMEHIIRALKREFQKIGKLWTPDDFGRYSDFVK